MGSSGGAASSSGGTTGGGVPDAGWYTYTLGAPVYECVSRTPVSGSADGGLTQSPNGGCMPTPPACFGEALQYEGNTHITEPERIAYYADPPASGPHWPCWAPWGPTNYFLPRERFVHNLEHGGVVILYRCDPSQAPTDGGVPCPEVAQPVLDFYEQGPVTPTQGDPRYLVVPSTYTPTTYTALAWGWRLELDTWDVDAITCFANAHFAETYEDLSGDPSIYYCPGSYAPPLPQ